LSAEEGRNAIYGKAASKKNGGENLKRVRLPGLLRRMMRKEEETTKKGDMERVVGRGGGGTWN